MICQRVSSKWKDVPSVLKQFQRFAGHSKWHNIRHTKAAKDNERSLLIARKFRDIKTVLAGNGWVVDVKQSPQLARAIEEAHRVNIPKETLESFLKKIKDAKQSIFEYRFQGPNDCVIIAVFSCAVQAESESRARIKKVFKTFTYLKLTTGFTHIFEKKGVILAKYSSKNATMDDAEEAAIISEAEEVRPEEDSPGLYRFLTEPESYGSVAKSLSQNNWEVLTASVERFAVFEVELSQSDFENIQSEVLKLEEIPECMKIIDNIVVH